MSFVYKNDYSETNVYGHVLDLLEKTSAGSDGIHLDVGCGFGSIAPFVRDRLKRTYIGVDVDPDGLKYLAESGFETSLLRIGSEAETFEALCNLSKGRRIASISIIDVLEHVPEAANVLRAVRRLAGESASVLIVSVPNVSHRDIAVKMLFGKFTLTEAGILDYTHVNFFTSDTLERLLQTTGWHVVAENDVVMPFSDQHFPREHVGLSEQTNLGALLMGIRAGADSRGFTNQLVRACLPGPVVGEAIYIKDREIAERPFLSIVMRTQGFRPDCFHEALLCLTAQSSEDFEVIVVGHKLDLERQLVVERVIADTPVRFREKVRLIKIDSGTRTAPLNVGFSAAHGRYIAILDDDDLVFGHWVETFLNLCKSHPGKMLRAGCAIQKTEQVNTHGRSAARAAQSIATPYPKSFDYFDHLDDNQTPCMSVAYPRSIFFDMGLRFDEELTTAEDWDFMMRAAWFCGVASSPEITALYRLWTNRGNSRVHQHDREWAANRRRIMDKMDARPILLPPGSAGHIRSLIDNAAEARLERKRPPIETRATPANPALEENLREEFRQLISSTSWRLTRPLRRFQKGPRIESLDVRRASAETLHHSIVSIYNSTCWRISAPLRAVSRIMAGGRQL